MKFWMSGEIQADVGEDFGKIVKELEQKISDVLEKPITETQFRNGSISIIRGFDNPKFGEIHKYSRRSKSVESRLEVNYHKYKEASFEGRREHLFRTAIVC